MSRAAGRLGAFVLALALCGAAAAVDVPATVEQPRPFGHVIGDVLTQRVLLRHDGAALQPAALPPADRVGLWFERRAPRVDVDDDGRPWLVIDYQVVNAPRALTTAPLPALSLATRGGPTLVVPPWPLTVGPLTAPDAAGGVAGMRPDAPVAPRATAPIERRLRASLLALGAVLAAWLAWAGWRRWHVARRLPFARAWRELRRLDPASAEAWLSLHRALDATAGRVVHAATLGALIEERPHLRALQAQLEGFFRHSGERFFAGDAAAAGFELRALGRALRDAERRAHG